MSATDYFEINKKYIVTVAIIVAIIMCIYWMVDNMRCDDKTDRLKKISRSNEEFISNPKKSNCFTCSNKTNSQCAADGRGECVAGNIDGPISKYDCSNYEYTAVSDSSNDSGSLYDWDDTAKRYYKKENGEFVRPYEPIPMTKYTSQHNYL